MKLITILWKERGYACPFIDTSEAPVTMASAEARRLVRAARANAGVFGLRVKISNHPWK